MVKRSNLFQHINKTLGEDLLATAAKVDGNANGIQVYGSEKVSKVAVGVSVSLDFFRAAVDWGADACISHHGLHLSSKYMFNSKLDMATQNQLKFIFQNNLTVAGYHYSLDAHPKIGNNAIIIDRLGAKNTMEPYFEGWGYVGEFSKPVDIDELAIKAEEVFEHDILMVKGGQQKVKRIGVCSGGAKPAGSSLHEIFDKGIDLHISGEIAESGPSIALDAGYNYFAAGHYNTETFGIQALAHQIQSHFGSKLKTRFIDIPNHL